MTPLSSEEWRIPLRGLHGAILAWTLVDQMDFVRFAQYSWSLSRGYARREGLRRNKQRTTLYLAREILGVSDLGRAALVDHINGDPLDNRRANLRIASQTENNLNQHKQRRNKTGFRGVTKTKNKANKYRARLKVSGRSHDLGYFKTGEEAGRAVETELARLGVPGYEVAA